MKRILFLIGLLALPFGAISHEMGTSALIISELQEGKGTLVFKRSKSADGTVPPIEFGFSPPCPLSNASTQWEEDNEVIQQATFQCGTGLKNHQLEVSGFTRLSPDLIANVQLLGQEASTHVLSPKRASISLSASIEEKQSSFSDYLLIGVEHIVLGWDHVLFVLALFLLWQRRAESAGQLIALFSVFTVGHSLTLALVVLDLIVVPTRAVEAWIALSVLWLAVQLANPASQSANSKHQYPLILLFGLLHGSGFALSMEERGFPAEALLSTLLAFNLGIELGQLMIVCCLFVVFHVLNRPKHLQLGHRAETCLVLLIGGASLFWTVERVSSYV